MTYKLIKSLKQIFFCTISFNVSLFLTYLKNFHNIYKNWAINLFKSEIITIDS